MNAWSWIFAFYSMLDVRCSMFIGFGKLVSRPVLGSNTIHIQASELPEEKYQE
jgi:hypothetical protein